MKIFAVSALALVTLCSQSAVAETYKFVNGYVFDGSNFAKTDFFVADGVIVKTPKRDPDKIIDLGGGYVTPPYADAHSHSLTGGSPEYETGALERFVKDGLFYVMVQDSFTSVSDETRTKISQKVTPDVLLTHTIVSGPNSAVIHFKRNMREQGALGPTDKEPEGDLFYTISDPADVARLAAELPKRDDLDFIKIIVAFSEEHEKRVNDPAYDGQLGLPPALLSGVIEAAQSAGKRASVHVESAADFELALDAGADFIAHLPGSWRVAPGPGSSATGYDNQDPTHWLLTEQQAQKAAANNAWLVTTTMRNKEHEDYETIAEIMRQNIALLLKHNANLIIGADFGGSPVDEYRHILEITGQTPAPLYARLVEDTPRALFPDRKIGRLDEGFEANFLVLDDNPLEDANALNRISLRMKNGVMLDTPENEEPRLAYQAERIGDYAYMLRVPGVAGADNVGVFVHGAEAVLIDSGFIGSEKNVRALLDALGVSKVSKIFNTHYHHAGANGPFGEEAEIITTDKAAQRMEDGAQMYGVMAFEPLAADGLPDIRLNSERTFRSHRFEFTALPFEHAHTDGDMVVVAKRRGATQAIYFTGDIFVNGLGVADYQNGATVAGYQNAIRTLAETVPDDAIVVPGHGAMMAGSDIDDYRDFLDAEIERMRAAIKAGATLVELKEKGLNAGAARWTGSGIPSAFFIENLYYGLTQTGG